MKDLYLHLDNLAVGYSGKALIHGIEIGVRRGEIVTLVGPNGSGKSTILKTITRQLSPVGGDIFLDASKLEQFTPGQLAQRMAVVLTGRLQTELMTCRDVAAMGRYPYTGRLGILSEEDERKVTEALAAVHAEHLSERPFDAVSDGERQRILLARAICQEPEIIVLDEPTSYLDIRHKLELLSILHTMSREKGITVVMSLHEIDLAMKISDRVICVRGEEIFACGKPAEILDNETVRTLYDLDPDLGYFDADTGSLELRFTERSGQESDAARAISGEFLEFSLPRLMIAAPGSGSGKTLITCGLLRLLQRHGMQPAAFKCGPDYIDPMFHRQVLGIPSRNLDTFFSPSDSKYNVREILAKTARKCRAQIAVIEGVMGYYDGTGESGMQASSCDLARQTDTPVILVVNAKGMSRSLVPVLKGLAEYESQAAAIEAAKSASAKVKAAEIEAVKTGTAGTESARIRRQIRGVILNRISAGMFPLMKKWIEQDTELKVIRYVPQENSISWGSRHLGLLQPEEVTGLQDQIDRLADILEETIDLDALLETARMAGSYMMPGVIEDTKKKSEPPDMPIKEIDTKNEEKKTENNSEVACGNSAYRPRIAVARDEAFSFYYEDNLELLQECGGQLVFFSPLHDSELPPADGLLLGGGYPELHARELAGNARMKAQIRSCAERGMPILAECGGFMYLQEYLDLPENKENGGRFEMCGVLAGTSRMTERLVRFGYIEIGKKEGRPGPAGYLPEGHTIRGHEFHYFDSTDNGEACTARKPGGKRSWDCIVVKEGIMAGYPHLYYRSDPAFAAGFVEKCREFAEKRS